MRILANLNISGTLDIDTVANAGVDTDRFLVQDSNGVVKFRTGAELLSDIGAASSASGLPVGGTAGQILAKIDGTNYNTEWIDNFTPQVKHLVKLGENMTAGTPVYVSGADGTNMIVSKASNASEATSSKVIGLLETGGVTNDQRYVITEGLIDGLDTSTATAGAAVWLGVNGALIFGLANKPVAPAHLVYLGVVTRVQSNNGEIFVSVQNGFELNEIHDVLVGSYGSKDILWRDTATNLWKNRDIFNLMGAASSSANGYLTSTDWSTFNNKIGGTGTTNYLPKFTGTSTIGNSQVFDNGTNVGIGTTSPSDKLHLNVGNVQGIRVESSNSGFIELGKTAASRWRFSNDYTNNDTFELLYGASGSTPTTSRILVTASGNVLIGTTTDAGYKLDVNGVTRFQDIVRFKTGVWNLSDEGRSRFFFGNAGRTFFGSADGYEYRSSTDTTLMILNNSGNLGLGVTPSSQGGAAKVIEVNEGTAFFGYRDVSNIISGIANNFYGIGTTGLYKVSGLGAAYFNISNGQFFWSVAPSGTAGTAISFTQAMTLNASGRLLLGTTTDDTVNILQVNGGVKIQTVTSPGLNIVKDATLDNRYIRFTNLQASSKNWDIINQQNSSGNNFIVYNSTDNIAAFVLSPLGAATFSSSVTAASFNGTSNNIFSVGGSEKARIDTSGNLGLGVTPSAWNLGKAFEINSAGNSVWSYSNDNIYLNQNAYYNSGWKYGTSATSAQYILLQGSHLWMTAASGTAGNAISFTQAMTLNASGNLLLGNTTNRLRLTVSGADANAPTLGTASGTAIFANAAGSAEYGMNFGVSSAGYGWIQQHRFDGSSTVYSLMLQPSGGRVVLGTTTDNGTDRLQVSGSGLFTGNVSINGTIIGTDQTYGGNYRTFAFGSNQNGYNRIFATTDAGDGMYFASATGTGFSFRPNGGTANTLTIASTGAATFYTQGSATYGTINLESEDPFIRLFDNGAGSTTDKKKWDIRAIGVTGFESFDIRTVNDANTVFSTKLSIAHSGVATFSSGVKAYSATTSASLNQPSFMGAGEMMSTGSVAGYFMENRSGGVTSTTNWAGWYYSGTSIRLYNGASDILSITASTGAATFSSSITASSFIKSGGTSAQFLKADGSIDSNTYVTGGPYLPLVGGNMSGGITFTGATGYTPLRFTGGVADYTIAEQDGAGRVNWYWNKSGSGTSPTFQVSSEDAVRLKFSTAQAAGAESGVGVYYAAAGTAGGAITWTEVMGAFHNGFRVLPAATFSNTVNIASNLTVDTNTLFVNASTDRVGMGTLSPITKLDIVGTSAAGSTDGISFSNTTSTLGTKSTIGITSNTFSYGSLLGNTTVWFSAGGSPLSLVTTDAQSIRFLSNYGETMRISPNATQGAAGNVLIGTTSDTGLYRLDVNGATRFIFRNASSEIMDLAISTETANPSKSKISLLWYGNETASLKFVRGGDSTGGALEFWTQPEGGTISQRMTLNSSGNLGLGVTPSAWWSSRKAFQIGSTGSIANFTRNTVFGDNYYTDNVPSNKYLTNGFATIYEQTSGTHVWYTAPSGTAGNTITFTQAMTLNASGRLLLGTTTDNGTDRLQVSGNIQHSSSSDNVFLYQSAISTRASLISQKRGTQEWWSGVGTNADNNYNIYDVTASATRFTIAASTGAATFSSSVTATQYNASSKYAWGAATNGTTGQIATDNTNNYFDYIGNLYFRGAAASNTLITFTNAGAATFSSSVTTRGQILVDDLTNGRITLENGVSQNDIYSTTTGFGAYKNLRISSNEIILATNGTTERMRITSGGNVGIGSTNPGHKLQVSGASMALLNPNTPASLTGADAYLYLGGSAVPAYIRAFPGDWYGQNYRLEIGTQASTTAQKTYMTFATEGAEAMRITSGQRLLLGTTTDNGTDRLQVSGNGYVSGSLGVGITPSYPLHVRLNTNSTTKSTLLSQEVYSSASGYTDYFRFEVGANSSRGGRIVFGETGGGFSDSGIEFALNATNIFQSGNSPISFTTNSIERLRVKGDGQLQFNAYTSTSSFSGTTAGYLAFDSSGNILTVAAPSGGITTLNTLTAATQTFAVGTSGTDFNISSATSTHTFNIPDASTTARGLITTGSQLIAGQKTFRNNIVSESTGDALSMYYGIGGGTFAYYGSLRILSSGQIQMYALSSLQYENIILAMNGSTVAGNVLIAKNTDNALGKLQVGGTINADSLLLNAGTTSLAPLDFTLTSAALKTTAAAGDMEVDANGLLYYTHNGSSRGYVSTEQYLISTTTRALTNSTASQNLFSTASAGASSFTPKANTTYFFEAYISMTGLSSSTNAVGFGLSSTGTVSGIDYVASSFRSTTLNTPTASNMVRIITNAISQVTIASTATSAAIFIRGTIRIGATAGVITPIISMITNAAVSTINTNTYVKFIPIGTDTIQEIPGSSWA